MPPFPQTERGRSHVGRAVRDPDGEGSWERRLAVKPVSRWGGRPRILPLCVSLRRRQAPPQILSRERPPVNCLPSLTSVACLVGPRRSLATVLEGSTLCCMSPV